MKTYRYSYILLTVLSLGLAVACGDPAGLEDPGFRITASDVLFQPEGGTGTITLDAEGVSAASDKDWCQVSVSGKTVTVTVPSYGGAYARSAEISLSDGRASRRALVYQYAVVVDSDMSASYAFDDAARVEDFSFRTNAPVEVLSDFDWLDGDYADGRFYLRIAENRTGDIRRGYLVISYQGELSDTVRVSQSEFGKDIAGQYYLIGYTGSRESVSDYEAEITGTADAAWLSIAGIDGKMPIAYNDVERSFTISGGQYLGSITAPVTEDGTSTRERYVWSTFLDSPDGNINFTSAVGMKGILDFSDAHGKVITFSDDGRWKTYKAQIFRLQYFTSASEASNRYRVRTGVYMLDELWNPVLQSRRAPGAPDLNLAQ